MVRKVLLLLNRRERWKLALLLCLATVSGLAQVVGVGSVVPFVGVLTDPEVIHRNELLRWAYDALGAPSTNAFLMVLGTGVLTAAVLANVLLAVTQWYTFRFGRWNQYSLSRQLLEAYLSRPFVYHIQHNSADAGKNILAETQTFTQQLLIPALQAVAFGTRALFIAAFLVWLSPFAAAIAVGTFGAGYGLVYLALRGRLDHLGKMRLSAMAGRFKAANEAFGAIKEIKSAGRETAFLDRYDPQARRFARATAGQQVLSRVPRYLIEVMGIASVLLVVVFLVMTGHSASTIIPLVGAYSIASYRIIPSLQYVYLAGSQLRSNAPVLDALIADLSDFTRVAPVASAEPAGPTRFPFDRAIELRAVSFTYPERETPALREVSLTIPRGGSIAFIGETGAGKTTLADIILGLLRPQQGEVRVDGVMLDDGNLRQWRREIGYVPQHIYLFDDTVASNIAFGLPPAEIDPDAVERAARIANIHDFIAHDLPAGYDTVIGERGVRLSGGQRQRLGIARALYHDPEVLVLDEATSALDSATEAAVQTAIHQVAEAKTLLIIAHRLTTIRACDLVCLLRHGQIVALDTYQAIVDKHIPIQAGASHRLAVAPP